MTEMKKSSMILIGLGITIFIFFGVWAKNRANGWGAVIKSFTYTMFVIAIIVAIVFVIYYLFMKRKKNMVAINKNAILSACNQCRPITPQRIAFKGDPNGDLEPRHIGYVSGFCRIKSEPVYSVEKQKNGKMKKIRKHEYLQLTLVSYRRFKGLIGSIFETPKIVCLVGAVKNKEGSLIQESDHSSLNGEIIYLNDGCFLPKRYEMYFLSRHDKKTWLIDECIKSSIDRFIMEEFYIQSQEIIDDGLAIGDKYKKERETSQMKEILAIKEGAKGK